MSTKGIDLREAAQHLKQSGIKTSDHKLREHLVAIGAIRKSQFGYEARSTFKPDGSFKTEFRSCPVKGRTRAKHYTVVLVTGDGISWLRDETQRIAH